MTSGQTNSYHCEVYQQAYICNHSYSGGQVRRISLKPACTPVYLSLSPARLTHSVTFPDSHSVLSALGVGRVGLGTPTGELRNLFYGRSGLSSRPKSPLAPPAVTFFSLSAKLFLYFIQHLIFSI